MAIKNVSADMKKIKRILKKVVPDRLAIANTLYDELEFMQKTLAKLKNQIDEEGPTSMFIQGKQKFVRENPALKAYNTTIQRYSLIYKQLIELLPAVPEEKAADPVLDFIRTGSK